MPLPSPSFDTRTYRELLAETLTRVPVHNPEWNNFNDADPGVTLLQLFAFMAESVIYRANLIPERNRQKFLHLLGIGLEPARSARGLVSFALPPDSVPTLIGTGDELRAGQVPFRPERGLTALPVESTVYYKKRVSDSQRLAEIGALYNRLYASIREEPIQQLEFYETLPLQAPVSGALLPALDFADTVDRSLWLALLAPGPDEVGATRRKIAGKVLTLGLIPALGADAKTLYPAGPPAAVERERLTFERPDVRSKEPRYEKLEVLFADDVLADPGLVDVRLPAAESLTTWENLGPLETGVGGYPPALDNSEDLDRLVTWIRVRAPTPEDATATGGGQSKVAISWAGINATRVIQRTHVEAERLSDGAGEPDQVVRVANTPVLGPSVVLTVNGEQWKRVSDLSEAGPEVPPKAPAYAEVANDLPVPDAKVFALDRESGEIRFGDGTRGTRPPRGALIMCAYDYGGGLEGLVGIGSIARAPERLPGVKVSNPAPTWGASDAETVLQAEKRISETLRHRNRLVSKKDYEQIARATPGVDVGRVVVLPLVHPDPERSEQYAEGVVTVLVIPTADPSQPGPPSPDGLFLETVCAHLEPRRILTTELHIRGPEYKPFVLGVGVQAVPGEPEGPLAEAVRGALLKFLSPLNGGFDGTGWPLNKSVEAAEIQAAATRVPGVAKVTGLVMADLSANALPDGLAITGLELPHAAKVLVTAGAPPTASPPTIDDLFGGPPPENEPPALAVPIAPEEC